MLKTTIVLISHQTPAEVVVMMSAWKRLNPEADIHVAYGGTVEFFDEIPVPDKTFVPDPRLRTRDHQRERQSYGELMRQVAERLAGRGVERVLLVECDVQPLQPGLVKYLIGRECENEADLLGVGLRRVDGTGHPHVLAHEHDSRFGEWLAQSVREEKDVVLMMLGCLTWWTWDAFKGVAAARAPFPVYLELEMPTTAHMLGFRVRDLPEFNADIEPLGELGHCAETRRDAGRQVLHPCKKVWRNPCPNGAMPR